MAKTINTLPAFPFPPFCGTKSLHPRLRLRKRFFGWNWLLCGPAFSHPSLVQSPLSVQHVKTVQWPKHSTHPLHLPSYFCGTKSLHYRLRLRKRFFGWNWSALSQPSLVQSPLSDQHIKTVQGPKHSIYSLQILFLSGQVFASQIKTEGEICWVKLT